MAVTAITIRETLKNPPQDPAAQKDLYNAALELMMGLESAQDTAQRLYHGVSLLQRLLGLYLADTLSSMSLLRWLKPVVILTSSTSYPISRTAIGPSTS